MFLCADLEAVAAEAEMSKLYDASDANPWALGCARCPVRRECRAPCAGAEAYADQDDPGYRREAAFSEIGDGRGGALRAVDAALGRELWDAGETGVLAGGVRIPLEPREAATLLSALTATQRRRLRAHFSGGASLREIARREGTDHKSVRQSVESAVRRLREALRPPRRAPEEIFSGGRNARAAAEFRANAVPPESGGAPPNGPFFSIGERGERGGER